MRRMRFHRMVRVLFALAVVAGLLSATGDNASASLTLLKPNPANPATFFGHGGYSADGIGQNGVGGTVQAEVPAGSTVVQAYLYASYFSNAAPSLVDRTIDFDGTNVVLTQIGGPIGCCDLTSARGDVTAQVAAKVGGGGGITDFAVNTDPGTLDGVGLVVIFSNASLPEVTIAVLDGAASPTGDTATFNFAGPLDKTTPGFHAIMSLGIGFSFQGLPGHVCGGGQFSTVDINGARLTSCAGNYDDGFGNNGALFTVGGVGDSTNNPVDPNVTAGEDDELYDLAPRLTQGDPGVTITTANASFDDIIFFAVIEIAARASVTTEICNNGVDDDGDHLIDKDDPDCQTLPPPTGCGGLTPTIVGTEHNDVLNGTPDKDVIDGGPGNDTIRGKGDADVLCGGPGNDRLVGGDEGDLLFGQEGDDNLSGSGGQDALDGGPDTDYCNGGADRDTAVNCETQKKI